MLLLCSRIVPGVDAIHNELCGGDLFMPSVEETCQIDEKCIGMHFSLTPDMRWGDKEPSGRSERERATKQGSWDGGGGGGTFYN